MAAHLAYVGFAVAALEFFPSTISAPSTNKKKISQLSSTLKATWITLKRCHCTIIAWDALWGYETHIDHGEDSDEAFVYQKLWRESYLTIRQKRKCIRQSLDEMEKEIQKIANIKNDEEVAWVYKGPKPPDSSLRKVQWTLFAEDGFQTLLNGLENDINHLTEVSKKEYERLARTESDSQANALTLQVFTPINGVLDEEQNGFPEGLDESVKAKLRLPAGYRRTGDDTENRVNGTDTRFPADSRMEDPVTRMPTSRADSKLSKKSNWFKRRWPFLQQDGRGR